MSRPLRDLCSDDRVLQGPTVGQLQEAVQESVAAIGSSQLVNHTFSMQSLSLSLSLPLSLQSRPVVQPFEERAGRLQALGQLVGGAAGYIPPLLRGAHSPTGAAREHVCSRLLRELREQ